MKKLLALLFLTFIVVSCSKDTNDDSDATPTPLEGKWILTNVSCFCDFGNNPDFSGHKITFAGNNLKVENTGVFSFLIDAEGIFTLQDDLITLKNGVQYTYVLKPDVLALTLVDNPQIADDEILLTYNRE
ncbi:MAG: hypothetical protein KJO52_15145 [Maribacter sp.]|nr:hypothetical protein [Maribacter sp.]